MFCGGVGSDGEAGNAHFPTRSFWGISGVTGKRASNATFHMRCLSSNKGCQAETSRFIRCQAQCALPQLSRKCASLPRWLGRPKKKKKKRLIFSGVHLNPSQSSCNSQASVQPSGLGAGGDSVCLRGGSVAGQGEGASWPRCSPAAGEQPQEKELPLLQLPRRRTGGGGKALSEHGLAS